MVEYTTRSELLDFAKGYGSLVEQASIRKKAESRAATGATFLSHSSKDEELVLGALRVLEEHGTSVYIDKKDQQLPPYTSKETARILKDRIRQSHKFVLLASTNSKDSKWVPWELGLADENKELRSVALFPAVDSRSETAWASWEYMGLYDRIVYGTMKGEAKACWMVLDREAFSATKLSTWLAQ
jgi:hypothetical protein